MASYAIKPAFNLNHPTYTHAYVVHAIRLVIILIYIFIHIKSIYESICQLPELRR